jgi:hypothetical protein
MDMDMNRWNGLLDQFLEELHEQFPSIDAVPKFRAGLVTAKIFDEKAPCRAFIDAIEPHVHFLRERNSLLFERLGTVGGIDFANLWDSTRDEHTRTIIFDYLCALFTGGYSLLYASS